MLVTDELITDGIVIGIVDPDMDVVAGVVIRITVPGYDQCILA